MPKPVIVREDAPSPIVRHARFSGAPYDFMPAYQQATAAIVEDIRAYWRYHAHLQRALHHVMQLVPHGRQAHIAERTRPLEHVPGDTIARGSYDALRLLAYRHEGRPPRGHGILARLRGWTTFDVVVVLERPPNATMVLEAVVRRRGRATQLLDIRRMCPGPWGADLYALVTDLRHPGADRAALDQDAHERYSPFDPRELMTDAEYAALAATLPTGPMPGLPN